MASGRGRARVAVAAATLTALALTSCSSGEQTVEGPVTVYVSLPLSGPRAGEGRDAADGARLALEQAGGRAGDLEVEAEFLDDASRRAAWDPVKVGQNARAAAQDSSTAAYIGELDSEPTRASLPITSEAGIVQISPSAGGVDLTRPAEGYPDSPDRYRPSGEATFVRLVSADDEVARAAVEVAGRNALRVRIVSDGTLYGELVAGEMTREAEGAGLEVRSNGQAEALLYAGGPDGAGAAADGALEAGAVTFIATDVAAAYELFRSAPGAVAVDGILLPEDLPSGFVADFRSTYGRGPSPYAAFGYEAMELALQGIEEAEDQGEFRSAIRDAIFGASRDDSVLGPYTVSEEGESSLCSIGTVAIGRASRNAPDSLCPE